MIVRTKKFKMDNFIKKGFFNLLQEQCGSF